MDYFQTSIWPIDEALIGGITTPGQSETGSDDIKVVLHILHISRTGASTSDTV